MFASSRLRPFLFTYLLLLLPISSMQVAAQGSEVGQPSRREAPLLLSQEEVERRLHEVPACLEGYRPLQSGPLLRVAEGEEPQLDTTFVVEPVQFESQGHRINGWIYLPEEGGPFPLVVLTNGGGNNVRAIRSFSDFIAPVLSHCGVAAFVHDKRGTGESEGAFRDTDYRDYITDTGNAGLFLARDPRFDPARIGVMGGSEGGRVAVIAANRYPVFSYAVSMGGPTLDMVEDRFLAQLEHLRARNATPEEREAVEPLMREELEAWRSGDPEAHEQVDAKIQRFRQDYRRDILPLTKAEMQGGHFDNLLPTWNSLKYDYVTEMERFRKPWLAIFSANDGIVPPEPNIEEVVRTTGLSGNPDVTVGVFPRSGHSPVDSATGQRVHFENLILGWMIQRGFGGDHSSGANPLKLPGHQKAQLIESSSVPVRGVS
jgi:pimeloyl-ACP methyl ester carboxylesterase